MKVGILVIAAALGCAIGLQVYAQPQSAIAEWTVESAQAFIGNALNSKMRADAPKTFDEFMQRVEKMMPQTEAGRQAAFERFNGKPPPIAEYVGELCTAKFAAPGAPVDETIDWSQVEGAYVYRGDGQISVRIEGGIVSFTRRPVFVQYPVESEQVAEKAVFAMQFLQSVCSSRRRTNH